MLIVQHHEGDSGKKQKTKTRPGSWLRKPWESHCAAPRPAWVPRAPEAQEARQGLTDQGRKKRKQVKEGKPAQLALNDFMPLSCLRPSLGMALTVHFAPFPAWEKWYYRKRGLASKSSPELETPLLRGHHVPGDSISFSLRVALSLK